MTDLLTLILGILFLYLLYKEKDQWAGSLSKKVQDVLQGARKFLTFIAIAFGFAFILGEIYAAMIYGFFPQDDLFWLPFAVELVLLIYYYMG